MASTVIWIALIRLCDPVWHPAIPSESFSSKCALFIGSMACLAALHCCGFMSRESRVAQSPSPSPCRTDLYPTMAMHCPNPRYAARSLGPKEVSAGVRQQAIVYKKSYRFQAIMFLFPRGCFVCWLFQFIGLFRAIESCVELRGVASGMKWLLASAVLLAIGARGEAILVRWCAACCDRAS